MPEWQLALLVVRLPRHATDAVPARVRGWDGLRAGVAWLAVSPACAPSSLFSVSGARSGLWIDLVQGLESRAAEQAALHQRHALVDEEIALIGGLDAFDEHRHAEFAAHGQDAVRDGLAGAAGVDAARQLHVELDDVGLEVAEQIQTCVTGAEIVNRTQEADAIVFAQACAPGARRR